MYEYTDGWYLGSFSTGAPHSKTTAGSEVGTLASSPLKVKLIAQAHDLILISPAHVMRPNQNPERTGIGDSRLPNLWFAQSGLGSSVSLPHTSLQASLPGPLVSAVGH